MKASRVQVLLLLSLTAVNLASRRTDGAEIPFFIDVSAATVIVCVQCSGPWLRLSALDGPYAPGTPNPINFYSAEINMFSPFGQWGCSITHGADCAGNNVDLTTAQELNICLPDFPGIDHVTISVQGNTASANLPSPPCPGSVGTRAFLGDSVQGKGDRDEFQFVGEAGETVEVTLAPDPRAGHRGSVARLMIVGAKGGPALSNTSGALPLKLTANLPRAGKYLVVVLEGNSKSGDSFRGAYVLTMNPSGPAGLLEPLRSVEAFP